EGGSLPTSMHAPSSRLDISRPRHAGQARLQYDSRNAAGNATAKPRVYRHRALSRLDSGETTRALRRNLKQRLVAAGAGRSAHRGESEPFRTRWAAHNVRFHVNGVKHFHHPVVGELNLNSERMDLAADRADDLHVHRRARLQVLAAQGGDRRDAETGPLRHRPAASTRLAGGHAIWWRLDAADVAAALALLPRYVRERTTVTSVREVEIP
ncbi:MAG: hypothetical protein QOD69_2536, partial [Solirubrobacteraceae bacterium]|nr:hypothetical protein [Solirubrobacteraceae bacterium]